MSNVRPVYPSGLFQWVDRIDEVNIDFANDINSVASDLISVETVLGTNPQKEPNPPAGTAGTINYATVSARISDAMDNSQLPVCELFASEIAVPEHTPGQLTAYSVNYDPFKMFNGTDITIPTNGWYIVQSVHVVNWWNKGYWHHKLTLNGAANQLHDDLIDWEFAGNVSSTGSVGTPRWQEFGRRTRSSNIFWQGLLHHGDRLSVFIENGTGDDAHQATNLTVKVAMLRTVSGTFTSG
jgi:hypothetical protein